MLQPQHYTLPPPVGGEVILTAGGNIGTTTTTTTNNSNSSNVKKRKMCESNNANAMCEAAGQENVYNMAENRACHCQQSAGQLGGRHFIHIKHADSETVFQTEDWQPSGSTLFCPLLEDVMINTRNVEQFSCSHGSFFVAGPNGQYSKSLTGEVLHLWRFCPQKRKLFISRSFLFKTYESFIQVQQALQRL